MILSLISLTFGDSEQESGDTGEVYKIEGKVTPPDNPGPDWLSVTTVSIDGGARKAFLREDNSFVFQVCGNFQIIIRFSSLIHYRAFLLAVTWLRLTILNMHMKMSG